MRGEWSNGMLCSARELGLGADHAGILALPPALPIGAPFAAAMGIERDVLYDLEINPNRPDAMSVAGVARDLAARLRLPFSMPAPQVDEVGGKHVDSVRVEVLDPDLCGRFTARVLQGVTVGEPNPDIARRFVADDLLICDGEDTPVGIAGIMGGADTEIDTATTDVLLEMAWFLPIAIAKTSRRLRLRSEASARFEKGTDPEVIELAHTRFAELLAPSGARLEAGTGDVRGELPAREPIRVRTRRLNRLLGTELTSGEIAGLLGPIGFATDAAGGAVPGPSGPARSAK